MKKSAIPQKCSKTASEILVPHIPRSGRGTFKTAIFFKNISKNEKKWFFCFSVSIGAIFRQNRPNRHFRPFSALFLHRWAFLGVFLLFFSDPKTPFYRHPPKLSKKDDFSTRIWAAIFFLNFSRFFHRFLKLDHFGVRSIEQKHKNLIENLNFCLFFSFFAALKNTHIRNRPFLSFEFEILAHFLRFLKNTIF